MSIVSTEITVDTTIQVIILVIYVILVDIVSNVSSAHTIPIIYKATISTATVKKLYEKYLITYPNSLCLSEKFPQNVAAVLAMKPGASRKIKKAYLSIAITSVLLYHKK